MTLCELFLFNDVRCSDSFFPYSDLDRPSIEDEQSKLFFSLSNYHFLSPPKNVSEAFSVQVFCLKYGTCLC